MTTPMNSEAIGEQGGAQGGKWSPVGESTVTSSVLMVWCLSGTWGPTGFPIAEGGGHLLLQSSLRHREGPRYGGQGALRGGGAGMGDTCRVGITGVLGGMR